jgi:type I restriction enzyme S subunit
MKESNFVQNLGLLKNLPKDWEVLPFLKVISENSGGNKKLAKNDFLEAGDIAVVDQGKEMIAGYANDINLKVKTKPPYIVFGDHTRAFKYIDFEFIMGADGTKVLQPVNESFNTKFLFYFFQSIDIPNTGYNRHFKYLKNLQIPLPPLATQKKIAAILDAADEHRTKTKALIDQYTALSQSLFLEMFGDPVTNPKGWEVKKLEDVVTISSGSTPSRLNEENYVGTIPWVKTGEVNSKIIYETGESISEEALANSSCKMYPKGSLIIAMYGQGKTRGKVGMLGIDATTNQACAVLRKSDKIDFEYLFNLLKLLYEDLRRLGRGGNQPNLNAGMLKSYSVIYPPITLQNEFAERVQAIEEQKAQAEVSLTQAEELCQSLLQRAFKGELV